MFKTEQVNGQLFCTVYKHIYIFCTVCTVSKHMSDILPLMYVFCIIMLEHLSIYIYPKNKYVIYIFFDNIFHLDVHYVCMLVQRFEPQGRRFTNFHYYYYDCMNVISSFFLFCLFVYFCSV